MLNITPPQILHMRKSTAVSLVAETGDIVTDPAPDHLCNGDFSFFDSRKTATKTYYCAILIAGGFQDPLRIEGGVFVGQYKRNIRMNWSLGAGSQFDS